MTIEAEFEQLILNLAKQKESRKDWCLLEPTHVHRQYIFNPEPAAIQLPGNNGHLCDGQPGCQNQRCRLSNSRSAGSNHTHAGAACPNPARTESA